MPNLQKLSQCQRNSLFVYENAVYKRLWFSDEYQDYAVLRMGYVENGLVLTSRPEAFVTTRMAPNELVQPIVVE